MHFYTSSYPVTLCIVDYFNGNIVILVPLLQKSNWITFTKHVEDLQSYKADTSTLSCITSTIYKENLKINEAITEQVIMVDQNNQFTWHAFTSLKNTSLCWKEKLKAEKSPLPMSKYPVFLTENPTSAIAYISRIFI